MVKSKHITIDNKKYSVIKKFLLENADGIQKLATKHHKEYLSDGKFRSEIIEKYQKNHIKVVKEYAKHLNDYEIQDGVEIFKKLGDAIAEDSVKDKLELEDAVDGIMFIKQAFWEKLEKEGLLDQLTISEFYQVSQAIGTYTDVVSSKIAFTYHRHSQKKLEEALKSKDEFISAATHELKTPVTTLKGFTQILQYRLAKEGHTESLEFFSKMDAQINRLTSLINDLLDVSRLESGRLQFRMQEFVFDKVIQETIDGIQLTSSKHKLILKSTTSDVEIYGDKDRLSQVISNLVTNAIKYSPEADKIIIKTSMNKKYVRVSVQDFGIGVAIKYQKKIFERFKRVMGGKEATFPGIGLGLYICSQIVKRHGGNIWVKSELGKGATFYFTLPIRAYNVDDKPDELSRKEVNYG
jgi:signal transduction histidine kinase